jgi:ribonuclease G
VVNDKKMLTETKEYVSRISPDQEQIVSLHSNGQPIFDTYGITKQVKASFGKTVNLSSGSYLIIEHTEALHVIDVNSGTRVAEAGQEQNALATNIEAAQEIVRQMRLRDLGGIVIIDFIDMKLPEHKKQVYELMEKLMESDRARHTILPISKFGLMQITRQRLRPEINISTAEICPTCKGTGKIGPSILLGDDIEKDLNYLINLGHRNLTLEVHPIVEGYLTKGSFFKPSIAAKWSKQHKIKLKVTVNNNAPLTEYLFYDAQSDDLIKL